MEALPGTELQRRLLWLVGTTLTYTVLRFYTRTLVFDAAREIEYELRNDVFSHLLRLPQSFYLRWRTGDIMSRCVNDINQIRLLMGVGFLNLVQTPVLFVAIVTAMFALNAKLALMVLLPYPLFIFVARIVGRAIHHWSLRSQEGLGEETLFRPPYPQ